MKLDAISEQLQTLGYDDDPSTSVYIETAGGIAKSLLLGNMTAMTDKYYIASFKSDGIIFMGLNLLRHFNGTSNFIPLSQIGAVTISKTKFMNSRLLLNADKLEIGASDGSKSAYICYNYMAGESFWKANIENVRGVVAAWPSIADRQAPAQPLPTSQPTTAPIKGLGDQLRELKGLLDDGIITQDEFDAKKKDLLGL